MPLPNPCRPPSFATTAHVVVVLAGERLWRFTRRETCLASNANIGGECRMPQYPARCQPTTLTSTRLHSDAAQLALVLVVVQSIWH